MVHRSCDRHDSNGKWCDTGICHAFSFTYLEWKNDSPMKETPMAEDPLGVFRVKTLLEIRNLSSRIESGFLLKSEIVRLSKAFEMVYSILCPGWPYDASQVDLMIQRATEQAQVVRHSGIFESTVHQLFDMLLPMLPQAKDELTTTEQKCRMVVGAVEKLLTSPIDAALKDRVSDLESLIDDIERTIESAKVIP
jgi:hypothetical protein